MFVKRIEPNSEEYQQACQLRYQLFYQPHGLSYDRIFNNEETESIHLVIINCGAVIAYGQLTYQKDSVSQISQMVVAPHYQQQGFGKKILTELIAIARQNNTSKIVLDARISATGFYQKSGFEKILGTEHPSIQTEVPHIYMQLMKD